MTNAALTEKPKRQQRKKYSLATERRTYDAITRISDEMCIPRSMMIRIMLSYYTAHHFLPSSRPRKRGATTYVAQETVDE